ncbi:site-specific integrase [Leptospirillum ferriphilum]|uniref:Site-specific recombinase XerD n=2 Tax=Leptospirillum ferriphilum TaxID=178606 RepID=A0A2I2MG31_9BACT|nr:site-specific integrase [Leptospirillum ferriphilum]
MAMFRKRSGSWQALVKRKVLGQIGRTFDTKADAEAWARQVETEVDRKTYVDRSESENTTLGEAIERYQNEITPLKKGARQEISKIRNIKSSFLSKMSLASIRGKDIAEYRDFRLKSVSNGTVRHELVIISHLFNIATKEWGLAGLENPVSKVRIPRIPQGRDRRLLPGELERIDQASESLFLSKIVRFALETAMRQSEIAGMDWNMVNIKKKTLTLGETKNGERRIVPLSKDAIDILSGLPRNINGMVWNLTSHAISVAFRRAVTRARQTYIHEMFSAKKKPDAKYLLDLNFHDLRHEATSRFFEMGLATEKVMTITGHKTYQMLKRYTHLKPENLADELDLLKQQHSRNP